METLFQDLRFAARGLIRNPWLSGVGIASLALGIAGNTIVFSLFSSLLLRPLPVEFPGRIAGIYTSDFSGDRFGASSYPDVQEFRLRLESFDQIVAMTLTPASLSDGGATERIILGQVSANYFSGLGIPLALGRGFTADEDSGAHQVVVLSHGLWTRRFGGDSAVLGRSIHLAGRAFTVIGVARRGFDGVLRGLAEDGWVPLAMSPVLRPGSDDLTNRGSRGLFVFGRLKPGRGLAAAQAEARLVAGQMLAVHPGDWNNLQGTGRALSVIPESEARIFPGARGPVLGAAALMLIVVGLVLLIVCANLANLLLSRAAARQKEMAVRLSLGASRGRLVQQLLTESLLLAALGGGGGLLLALWVTGALSGYRPDLPVPLALDIHLDARVLAFALGVSVLAGLVVGLAPALQASASPIVVALKEESGTGGRRRSRLRNAFVVAQVSLSLVLLVGAGLFLRSLRNAMAIDPGFGIGSGLMVSLDLSLNGYDDARSADFQRRLVERVRALPGVAAASLVSVVPLSLGAERRWSAVEGYAPRQGEDMEFHDTKVGPGYFETMRVPLVAGRGFTEADRAGGPGVIIVNQAFARRFWPGQEALGKRVSVTAQEGPWLEVIGVARDGKYVTLGEEPTPFFYLPLRQHPSARVTLVARTADSPERVTAAVRGEIHALDPDLPIESQETVEAHLGFSLLPARIAGAVLGAFGLFGLLLASLGVYGVLAYAVSQRVREIGVRVALGARGADIVGLVLGEGMRLVAIGIGLGLVVALATARLIRGFLYGLSPLDPVTFAGVAGLFAAIAALASYLPALRAARLNPVDALRSE
jgi:macrolide transport system ATP-binding/permease protein